MRPYKHVNCPLTAHGEYRAADVERSYFVMDWWLAGPPALVASWGRIASEWDAYAARNAELGIGRKWSHFLWAQHVHEALATLFLLPRQHSTSLHPTPV